MTDTTKTAEERAWELIEDLGLETGLDKFDVKVIAQAITDAEQRGYERGLEAAANIADAHMIDGTVVGPTLWKQAAETIGAGIRALKPTT